MKYCTNCGKELIEGADFCTGCGHIFNKPKAQTKLPNWVIAVIIGSFIVPMIVGIVFTIIVETFDTYNNVGYSNSYDDYNHSTPYDYDHYSNYYHNY